ncbi:MarR family transcriptional regulator [Actinocrispum wychmicini]|uniref:DNA-binding MarR family transcriptional regulator n=1 Tax=Actinocrispum wychmicini TaxID=1213861 RepID=A0A4R2JCR6_9PSEU|nr:MarR family transcriptional regulator [Actinocrispum wychmicini]TCO55832.1 DNA-binding MarR family transcriptional regulator [Actinocrispum wychmicini]
MTGALTLAELSVLGRLDREGATTAAALAVAERVTPQAMATVIAGLTDCGMVTRTRDTEDKRRLLVEVSDEGRQAMRGLRQENVDRLTGVLAERLTPAERRRIAQALPILIRLADLL